MFVRYYVELAHPKPEVEHILLSDPAAWLGELASDADERGQTLLTEVGFPVDGHYRVKKRVSLTVREPIRSEKRSSIPMKWQATGPRGLFPVLEGELEVAPLGTRRSQLSFNAYYQPPLGFIGKTVDRALLFRVAEATVKDFVDHVAERLNGQLPLKALPDTRWSPAG